MPLFWVRRGVQQGAACGCEARARCDACAAAWPTTSAAASAVCALFGWCGRCPARHAAFLMCSCGSCRSSLAALRGLRALSRSGAAARPAVRPMRSLVRPRIVAFTAQHAQQDSRIHQARKSHWVLRSAHTVAVTARAAHCAAMCAAPAHTTLLCVPDACVWLFAACSGEGVGWWVSPCSAAVHGCVCNCTGMRVSYHWLCYHTAQPVKLRPLVTRHQCMPPPSTWLPRLPCLLRPTLPQS